MRLGGGLASGSPTGAESRRRKSWVFLLNGGGISGFNMNCGQSRREKLDKESANF